MPRISRSYQVTPTNDGQFLVTYTKNMLTPMVGDTVTKASIESDIINGVNVYVRPGKDAKNDTKG